MDSECEKLCVKLCDHNKEGELMHYAIKMIEMM